MNQRIVSLIPSGTEIVYALGLKDSLVGRSHECDFPSFVKKLPICTEPTIDVSASSREIDDQVKSHLKNGLSIYKIDVEKIEALKPDVILTQSHCEVCAVSRNDVEKSLSQKLKKAVKILSSSPLTLDQLWVSMQDIANQLGVPEKGREKIELYKSKMSAIAKRAEGLGQKPKVAAIEWIDPLMAAGNWVPELVAAAGGINLFGEKGKHSPWMNYEDLIRSNPDVILFLPCGFSIERTRDELESFALKKGWFDTEAVKNNQVYLLDGNQYFNRPGPRLVESLEILAEIFHPDEFDFGHKNDGWQYWGFNRF